MANVCFMHSANAADRPMTHHPIDATAGPGWYDSSWDLQRGLEVHEGLPGDLTLHEWLEHHMLS